MQVPAVIMEGAEPFSASGGSDGVLVIHGITGSPGSVRDLAVAFAAGGFTVEAPLLPGHGTVMEDLLETGWAEWSAAVEAAYQDLAGRCRSVVVAGLSMGGTLACWLVSRYSEVAGLVCVNPMIEPVAPSFLEILRGALAEGVTVFPGIPGDIARPGKREPAYSGVPVAPTLSLMEGVAELEHRLDRIKCPLLLFTSSSDHVVPPSSSDHLAARVSGPVERVLLERSLHVATLDWDAPEIERRAVDFARSVTGTIS